MKIVLALPGDDIGEHFKNIYHRIIKNNESVITSFNGITAVLFPDENEFEHPIGSLDPMYKYNLDAVKAYYLGKLEAKDPSGYTEVKKYHDHYANESRQAIAKVRRIQAIVDALEMSEKAHVTIPPIHVIKEQLKIALLDRQVDT